ncbi:hypothetical protein CVIRNUC_003921 [Coccomyxa viridis]|uniref:Extracellular protein n=1 Tax=Coccomyxa viridis TaxID=1274662 RepID=A0AAV1I1L2_9CHLO|nr:hypothetical protein CVIRNUC_003921 [Coccomyxa viridis]
MNRWLHALLMTLLCQSMYQVSQARLINARTLPCNAADDAVQQAQPREASQPLSVTLSIGAKRLMQGVFVPNIASGVAAGSIASGQGAGTPQLNYNPAYGRRLKLEAA